MNKNTIHILLNITYLLCSVSGIIFLCISIFGEKESDMPLVMALAFIALGLILNSINANQRKKNSNKE